MQLAIGLAAFLALAALTVCACVVSAQRQQAGAAIWQAGTPAERSAGPQRDVAGVTIAATCAGGCGGCGGCGCGCGG